METGPSATTGGSDEPEGRNDPRWATMTVVGKNERRRGGMFEDVLVRVMEIQIANEFGRRKAKYYV